MMLSRCGRSCDQAQLFSFWSQLQPVDQRPNPATTAVVDRAPAARAEEWEVEDAGAEVVARLDRWVDVAAVEAPAAARRIRCGVRAASPAPARAMSAAVPASPVRRRTAEPARLDRAARPAAAAPAVAAAPQVPAVSAGAAAPPARAVLAARPAPAAAAAPAVDRAGRADPRCAARARARAASFACDPAVAAPLRAAIRSPMAANVRPDGPIGLSATPHRHRDQAARSHRARLPLLSASRGPRRAAPRSPARASRRTSARPAEDAASSAAEKSFVNRPDLQTRRPTGRDRHAHDRDRRWLRQREQRRQ